MRRILTGLVLALFVLPLYAQEPPDPNMPEGEDGTTPPSWQVRLDKPMDDVEIGADKETADIWFVNMTPGWHITTGPAAIFYHPMSQAEGTYRAEATIHLFDPGERREAYGMFVGGQNLDGDDVGYDYFLLRNTGEFLIKRRTGGETSVIMDWTAHESVGTFGPETERAIKNMLAVDVGAEDVGFFVNGAEVARMPRSSVHTDGVVGLRINHALNVHVGSLSIE